MQIFDESRSCLRANPGEQTSDEPFARYFIVACTSELMLE